MRNTAPPLRHVHMNDPSYVPLPSRRPGSPLVEAVWSRIAAKTVTHNRRVDEFHSAGLAERDLANMRMAFAAGLYAASAALNAEGATSLELSEAAERIESAP